MDADRPDPVALAIAGVLIKAPGHPLGLAALTCRCCGETWPMLLDPEPGWERCPRGCSRRYTAPSDQAVAVLHLAGVPAFNLALDAL